MPTLTRKQRELAAREQLILDTARGMFLDGGYLGLNMDRIAEAIEYSKGTVYQHFANKEDLVGALAVETLEVRHGLFRRAAAFSGRPRERIVAVGIADQILSVLHREHAGTERLLDVSSIFEKTSDERRQTIISIKEKQMDVLLGIVEDAIEQGDLSIPDDMPRCMVLYGLWAMAMGHATMQSCTDHVPQIEDVDRTAALWHNYQMLLDGYVWKPLSHEWDYQLTAKKVYEEVFPDEYIQIQQSEATG